jgi:hypothetical protein
MRLALAFCVFQVLAICAAAQDPMQPKQLPDRIVTPLRVADVAGGPADLRLTGPSAGSVGSPVTIVVSGLPTVDLTATVGEQTVWVESIRFDVSAPAGAEIELEKELSMSVSPWAWRLRLTLTPGRPGTYLIVCDWNQEPYGLAMHRVEVGGPSPPPVVVPPVVTPDPTDPPLPSRPTAAVYIYEKDQTSPPRPVQAALDRLSAGDSGIVGSMFEQDATTGTGAVPAQYREALTAARAAGLPVLVVMAGQAVLRVVKNPLTSEAVEEAVK